MERLKATDVADWFLSKQKMSPKKLQKLCYYAYAWYLTLMNEEDTSLNRKLFDEKIEAWVHGPVIYSIYQKYKDYSFNEIEMVDIDESKYTEDEWDVLRQVWEVYGGYNANELESFTHREEPWIEARRGLRSIDPCNTPINDKTMFRYYLAQASYG